MEPDAERQPTGHQPDTHQPTLRQEHHRQLTRSWQVRLYIHKAELRRQATISQQNGNVINSIIKFVDQLLALQGEPIPCDLLVQELARLLRADMAMAHDTDFIAQYTELLADIHIRTSTTARRDLTHQDIQCLNNARVTGYEIIHKHYQNHEDLVQQLQQTLDSIIDDDVQTYLGQANQSKT